MKKNMMIQVSDYQILIIATSDDLVMDDFVA